MPAYTAEVDAEGRLGLEVVDTARHIDAAIVLRYPTAIKDAYDLSSAISGARLSYCVLHSDGTRDSGWLDGAVEDLADLIRLVSVPQRAVNEAADALQKGIDRAANILEQLAKSRPEVVASIAGRLGMSDVIQTYRMAGAIVANAMVFHERLVGMHGIKPLSQLCSPRARSPKANILDAWTEVLKINYWPIFAIARDIVEQLPAAEASQTHRNLHYTVDGGDIDRRDQAHDLTGRIFQRLIADRKYLATFYTLPASAALLARLAVAKLCPEPAEGMDVDWSDPEAIANLRIGDFACGTGALLSAVYEQIAARHERAGGDLEALHPVMMEDVLYGCDVMPSAIHITGSTLSGAQPNVGFGNTRLYTLAYGRQEDGTVRIGSLELLQSSSATTLFNTSDPALAHRQRRRGDRLPGHSRCPGRGFRPRYHEPPVHARDESRRRSRRCNQPRVRRVRSDPGRPDRNGKANQPARKGDLLPRQRRNCLCIRGIGGQKAQARRPTCVGVALVGGIRASVARLPADAGIRLLRLDRPEHRRQWQGYVLLVRHRHGRVPCHRTQRCPPGFRHRTERISHLSATDHQDSLRPAQS